MVWRILRPHYWMLDRKVRQTNRVVVIALVLILGFGGQWVYDNLIRDNLVILNSEQVMTVIASFLPLGFSLLLLFALLGVGDTMHQLYLASDLELLMVAPIPYRTIFFVKLLQCSRATFIPALSQVAFLVALGMAYQAGVLYYLLAVSLILAAMILTTVLVMLIVILLARLLPARKIRSWMPAVLILATFVLMLGQQSATSWLLEQKSLVTFLTKALFDPGLLGLVVAGLGGLALVSCLAVYWVFDNSFHEGWNRFHEVPTRRAPDSPAAPRLWGVARVVRPLPLPLRNLLIKEWLEMRRNPRGLINLAQPLVLILMVLVLFMSGGEGHQVLQPFLFWFLLLFLAMFWGISPVGMSLLSIAGEGHRIALLRSVPLSMSSVLQAKFWATWVPMVLAWLLVLPVAGSYLQYPLWLIGFLVGLAIWGLAGASAVTVAMGGLRVDFMAEELKQRIPTTTSYLIMGLNLVFVLLAMGTGAWLMVHLFPNTSFVQAIQPLAGYGLVGQLFSDSLTLPLVLASGQAVFWIGVKVLWAAAVRRLEGWEES